MPELIQAPHQGQSLLAAGRSLNEARAAMILVHGRGATAQSILELGAFLEHPDLAYLAPQASGNTWYPYSFLAPFPQNEPGITSGLQAVAEAVTAIEAAGIPAEKIRFRGSPGNGCVTLQHLHTASRG